MRIQAMMAVLSEAKIAAPAQPVAVNDGPAVWEDRQVLSDGRFSIEYLAKDRRLVKS